ncbi:DUF924 family protein [Psychromonas hadalis]|uniref:DUF924 family protein n=1 Tax=Psychromonas hadalis TaxID=211669 RepID=UPI0003B4DF57|nr:DUF924 family protein [Psychromonas hadalis]
MSKKTDPSGIIKFWFEEIDSALWWKKDLDFDALIAIRFSDVYQQACVGELFSWRITAEGRLAEIIILDQFSRNIFRDKKEAFAQDSLALVLAQEAINIGAAKQLTQVQRSVLYLPFMHSESMLIHQQAEMLYADNGLQASVEFELKHKQIIEQFGRYPHRNQLLNRHSTQHEIEFLTLPNSSF